MRHRKGVRNPIHPIKQLNPIHKSFVAKEDSSIETFSWDNMTNTTARTFDISRTPRDQVYVSVINGLPGVLPVVDSDIEPPNAIVERFDPLLRIEQQIIARVNFGLA